MDTSMTARCVNVYAGKEPLCFFFFPVGFTLSSFLSQSVLLVCWPHRIDLVAEYSPCVTAYLGCSCRVLGERSILLHPLHVIGFCLYVPIWTTVVTRLNSSRQIGPLIP
ncbi:hypothetical protein V8F33_002926 [Rhypophila sp. PSN 637]